MKKIVTLTYPHEFIANTHILFLNDTDVIAFDLGQKNDTFKRYLAKHQLNLVAVFLTHGHFDHIQGLNYLDGNYPIYLYKNEVKFLKDPFLNCSRFIDGQEDVIVNCEVIPIEDGDILSIDNVQIKVIHTPFHTSGSCCFLINEEQLISGDVLFKNTIGRSDLPTSSPRTIKSSLYKLKSLINKYPNLPIYPGHGENTNLRDEIEHNENLKNV